MVYFPFVIVGRPLPVGHGAERLFQFPSQVLARFAGHAIDLDLC